uniref:Uncharacterized protein n=1 Tax=Oryza rufipogon TaxID=4529 RepID=A0A0E0NUH6_ORYRU
MSPGAKSSLLLAARQMTAPATPIHATCGRPSFFLRVRQMPAASPIHVARGLPPSMLQFISPSRCSPLWANGLNTSLFGVELHAPDPLSRDGRPGRSGLVGSTLVFAVRDFASLNLLRCRIDQESRDQLQSLHRPQLVLHAITVIFRRGNFGVDPKVKRFLGPKLI